MRLPSVIACALAVSTQAQARLEVHLTADAARSGPPGLVFARGQLSRFGFDDIDTFGPLAVSIDEAGLHLGVDAATTIDTDYLRGRIVLPGGVVAVRCDAGGHETWSGRTATLALEPLQTFVACVDATRSPGKASWLDVGSLVGVLATGIETESPLGLMLSLGASECGELVVRCTTSGEAFEFEGRSGGGLTLPALLATLARRHVTKPMSEEERWTTLAFAARDGRREEAALQLARFDSERSARCLLALLQAPDFVRECALSTLARRREEQLLPEMAATTAFVDRDPVATATLATLWPECSPLLRRRTRTELAGNLGLLAALDHLELAAEPSHPGTRSASAGHPRPRDPWHLVLVLLLAVPAVVLARRVLSGPSRRPRQRIS
ncbi:MAG: hypothetical protein R3F56_06940 [Planctomycetota bacterium]